MLTAFVQMRAVDYGALEVEVRTHPDQYKELLDRFVVADTTLTADEMAEVYYGFACTPSYEPTDTFPEVKAALEAENYPEVARLAEEALQLNPVSLEMTMAALKAYEQGASDTPGANALKMTIRRNALISTILDSGKGTSAMNPFYVISDQDAKQLLFKVLGIGEITGTSGVGDSVVAYQFIFAGLPRMHLLFFDEGPQIRFKK